MQISSSVMPFSSEGTGTATFVFAAADAPRALFVEVPAAGVVVEEDAPAAGAAPNEKVGFFAADSPAAGVVVLAAGAGVVVPLAAGLPKEKPPAAGAAGVVVPEAAVADSAGLAPKLKPPVAAGALYKGCQQSPIGQTE